MMMVAHCLHCGRIWPYTTDAEVGSGPGDNCPACGKELYPVSRRIVPGEELKLGDGWLARVSCELDEPWGRGS